MCLGHIYAVCDGTTFHAIKCGCTEQEPVVYLQQFLRVCANPSVLQLLSTPFPRLAEAYFSAVLPSTLFSLSD